MSTDYPADLDALTNPTATDQVATVDHAAQHANANDAIEALEAKVGKDGSGVTTSHDYKLSDITTTDKAVGISASQVLTNKTLTSPVLTTPKITTSINDANGNEVIKTPATASAVNEVEITNAATGNDPLIAPSGDDTDIGLKLKGKGAGKVKVGDAELQMPDVDGSDGELLKTNGSGVLSWVAATTVPDADESTKGTVEEATDAEVTAGTATGSTGAKLFVTPTKLQTYIGNQLPQTISNYGTSNGTYIPSVYLDTEGIITQGTYKFDTNIKGQIPQTHDIRTEEATADSVSSVVLLNGYYYVLFYDNGSSPHPQYVYRYSQTNLDAGGTIMTFSGAVGLVNSDRDVTMTSDGTTFYFTYQAGNSANSYVLSEFSVSGTVFTYVGDITCGSAAIDDAFVVKADGTIYAQESSGTDLYKFDSDGTLNTTYTGLINTTTGFTNIMNTIYWGDNENLSKTAF